MAQINCEKPLGSLRKTFWTTKLTACGSYQGCEQNEICGHPGLSLIDKENGSTIASDDFVTSLILNILLTNARKEATTCGYIPGTQGGFWGDSFRMDNGYTGSGLRNIPDHYSVREAASIIKAYVQKDMEKLILYGVAQKVDVGAKYSGSNAVSIAVNATGQSGIATTVGLNAVRIRNSWVWDT